jgi:hypothetical protein
MSCTKPCRNSRGLKINLNGSLAELDADGVMARLEDGITRRKAFDRLGGSRLYAVYCAANPEWAKRAEALLKRNAEAAAKRKGLAWRRADPTRCHRGHDLTKPENVRDNSKNGHAYVECKVCGQENARFRGKLMSPEKRAKVMQAMARKARLETIKCLCDTNGFYRQRRRDPEFAAAADQWLIGYRARQGKRLKVTIGKRRYSRIDAVVPKNLPMNARQEIINMIYSALRTRTNQTGRLILGKLSEHAGSFVSAYYKQNPVKAYGRIDSPWSLDEIVPGTDGLRWIDTVSKGLW